MDAPHGPAWAGRHTGLAVPVGDGSVRACPGAGARRGKIRPRQNGLYPERRPYPPALQQLPCARRIQGNAAGLCRMSRRRRPRDGQCQTRKPYSNQGAMRELPSRQRLVARPVCSQQCCVRQLRDLSQRHNGNRKAGGAHCHFGVLRQLPSHHGLDAGIVQAWQRCAGNLRNMPQRNGRHGQTLRTHCHFGLLRHLPSRHRLDSCNFQPRQRHSRQLLKLP